MTKKILFLAFLLLPAWLFGQAISIAAARLQPVGSTVTVRGVVTNGAELGKIRYLQDGTAGIAAYPGAGSAAGFEASVTLGDSIEVTGTLVSYFGLLEITPITSYSVIIPDAPWPAPKLLKLSEMSEEYEGQLVGFECVVFTAGGGFFSNSGSFNITDADGSSGKVYLQSGHPMIGTGIPGTPIFLTAILSDFNDFQLLPRSTDDFSQTQCFYFTDQLEQTNISTTGFDVTWATNLGATSQLHYGTSPALGSTLSVSGTSTTNTFALTGLQPGSVYWVQIASEHNGSTIYSTTVPFATQSLSSGQIKVYFNHSIHPSFANGYTPEGQTSAEVIAETIARINAAQQTLDVAMYNNNRSDLTTALKNAHNRGVRVRYVAALDASNPALNPLPDFPVLFGNTEALMHDKFMVIDADLADQAWVMSGSLNWTNQNINTDYNNTLFIQDQSLARTYELEFEEMWGSESAFPNEPNSLFASNKRNNTPHHFIIGGKQVDSWFSPSDLTTNRIVETIRTADSEALFATFSFTKNEIGDALVDAHNSNVGVRGMIENISDPGAEIDYLNSEGIDCRPHSTTGDLHHKYGVIDANGSDPIVLTGSHNWTISAETVNDENTLVIHDQRLATLYKAEFEQRWADNAVSTTTPDQPLMRVFPNPAKDVLNVKLVGDDTQELVVRNLLGEVVISQRIHSGIPTSTLFISQLSPGYYIVHIRTSHAVSAVPFQKI